MAPAGVSRNSFSKRISKNGVERALEEPLYASRGNVPVIAAKPSMPEVVETSVAAPQIEPENASEPVKEPENVETAAETPVMEAAPKRRGKSRNKPGTAWKAFRAIAVPVLALGFLLGKLSSRGK